MSLKIITTSFDGLRLLRRDQIAYAHLVGFWQDDFFYIVKDRFQFKRKVKFTTDEINEYINELLDFIE